MNLKVDVNKDWDVKRLGEVCEIIMGQSPPSDTYNYIKLGLPFFQGKAEFTDLHPVVKKWCSKPKRIAVKNDILLSVRAPVGTTNIANQKCCIGRGLAAIRYQNYKFIFYFLKSIEQELDKKGTGTTFKAISGNIIRNVVIPLPPLPEQQKIVAKIEQLFSELDKGKEQLETALQQLKIYRQAVLKWAFEGKLTNKNVKEGELPERWKWVTMGEVIEKPKYGTSKKCDYNIEGKGVLRIPNIGKGIVDSTDLKSAVFDEEEIQNYKLNEGDILTIRSNGSVDLVGKCALIFNKDKNYLYAGYLIRLRPLSEKINSKYLLQVLTSSNLRNQIELKAKSTSGVNNINTDELKSLILPLPIVEEQNQIVQEIGRRLSVCDKIEETITHSLKQAESLRQSILKKAFEGKLLSDAQLEDQSADLRSENKDRKKIIA